MTSFGKFLRKLRIENNERLSDMATKLVVTPAYLSLIELGKRNIPPEWESIIPELYNLNDKEIIELKGSIVDSLRVIKINMEDLDISKKRLLFKFYRRIKEIDEETVSNINNLLE